MGGGKGQTTARGRGEDEAGHAGGEQRRESGRGREALVTRDGRFCAKKLAVFFVVFVGRPGSVVFSSQRQRFTDDPRAIKELSFS